MTKKLDKLRKNIDDIDKKLLELISNRGLLAKEIGLLKDDGVIYKPEREAQVITKLIKENKGPLSNDSVTNIYKAIISNCRALEKKLAIYKAGDDSAKRVVNRMSASLPSNYTIGGDKKLKFSKSGTILEFGIQPILPAKDTSLPEFERAVLDIWHYNDAALQTVQVKSLETDLKATEPVLYNLNDGKMVYLGKIRDRNIISTLEGDGAISFAIQDSTYQIASQWQGYSLRDIYQINNKI